jgi:hypothetical protein
VFVMIQNPPVTVADLDYFGLTLCFDR